jgi:hypothetical protein
MRAIVPLGVHLSLLIAGAAVVAASCGGKGSGRSGAGGGDLHWFSTCGDPVCMGHRDHAVAPCTTERVGEPCSPEGVRCDPGSSCNQDVVCTTTDPTTGPGGCPISKRELKDAIRYLTPEERKRVRDELVAFRLATWDYRAPRADGTRHFGFIIDDVGPSPSVAPNGSVVDLYGYTSMAVAALQEQAAEIDELKREVAQLRKDLEAIEPGSTQTNTRLTSPPHRH